MGKGMWGPPPECFLEGKIFPRLPSSPSQPASISLIRISAKETAAEKKGLLRFGWALIGIGTM